MAYSIKAARLLRDGKPVAFRASPNIGGALKPTYLVMHYTGAVSAAGAIATLCDPAAKVSAHLVIDQAGVVTQLVPFDRVAWHAGASRWAGRSGCNSFSIGIELANPGLLARTGAGGFATRLERKAVAAKDVILAAHKNGGGVEPWAAFPAAQIAAAIEVGRAIVAAYGLKDVIGHDDIAPGRKIDPGPAFPMDPVRARVMGRADGKKAA